MIGLSFNIDNLDTVLTVYNQIQIIRYTGTDEIPDSPSGVDAYSITDWTVVSGTDSYPVPINLIAGTTYYTTYDPEGDASDYFSSRYINSGTGSISGWSDPVLGESADIYYDPQYPVEIQYGTEDQTTIKQLRMMIGDPVGLHRVYGGEALSYIHPDHKVFQLPSKGWPVFVTLNGENFNSVLDPTVNGYRYLKFSEPIDEICTTVSGFTNSCGYELDKEYEIGIDIWWYTFRFSDRELISAYDNCLPPFGLTTTTATTSAYLLQTAINLLTQELLEDATENGAKIADDKTNYDPTPGLQVRKDLLAGLKKDLKDLITLLLMNGISGVLID